MSDVGRPLRLVHVIEGLNPNRGGPPVVAVALAAAQARMGHAVTIVCEEAGSPTPRVNALLAQTRGADRVAIERVPRQSLFAALYSDLRKSAPVLREGVDLLHLHGVWNPIVLSGSRAARRIRAPYLVSSHGALHASLLRIGTAKKRTALALGWRRMLAEARHLLCLNEAEVVEANHLARRSTALLVPNGTDVSAIPTQRRGGFREFFEPLRDRAYFVFLGRLDPLKGLDALVEAFIAYRRAGGTAHLALVGPDSGSRADVEALAQRGGVAESVHFVGPLYDERKFAALHDAIAIVHRPRFEAFGLLVIEALAVGTPAIVGDGCLLPIVDEADGVVRVHGSNPGDFAQAMLRVERDPLLRERLGASGRALVAKRFDWDAIARTVLGAAGVLEPESATIPTPSS